MLFRSIPCVAGVRQGGGVPASVEIEAGSVSVNGEDVSVQSAGTAAVGGGGVDLQGEVFVNGEPLEEYIARIVASML